MKKDCYLTQKDIGHSDWCVILSYQGKCFLEKENELKIVTGREDGRRIGLALLNAKMQVELAFDKLIS